jgi:uncharacterized protein YjbI with pentapeptide repeats
MSGVKKVASLADRLRIWFSNPLPGLKSVSTILFGATLALAALLAAAGPRHAAAADCGDMAAPGINWSECHRNNIILQGSDLHGANLSGTHFDSTDLSNTNLQSANLEKATMVRAWLTDAHAEGANFSRIEAYRSSFANVIADGARFTSAELQRADFSGAKLEKTDFQKAELGRANFDKADLTGTSFMLANLSRANLSGAKFQGPIGFGKAFMYLTRIEGLDLSAATNLEQAQVDLACGDKATKLPPGLKMPTNWPCPPDDKD